VIALLKNTAFFVFVVCSMPLFAQVQPGAYQTQKYIPLLINMKVAVVGNHSSQVLTNDKRIHLVDHLRSQGVNIIKVFAPEHGFRGKKMPEHPFQMKSTPKLEFPLFHCTENTANPPLNS